jgi:glycosyltransferase involved in cell wall biosynthesis
MAELVRRRPHARRVVTIAHGVSLGRDAPPMPPLEAGPLVLGYAGRLFPGKGVDVLLRAIALLQRRDTPLPVILRVAGDGECRKAWEELARGLGIADRVSFSGWTEDVIGHWAACHVAVTPSNGFVESFCMSAAEAMLMGRPAIVTDRGALPELVVPGVTGQIAAAGDGRALAAAIAAYALDPRRVSGEGEAARQRIVTHYSLRESASRYLELASELLAQRVRRRGRW